MKKLIAAAATVLIAVALSLVAVAAPASAHTAFATGVATCNADGTATVKWTLDNDYNETANVTASDNAAIPVNTTVAATGGGNNPDTTTVLYQTIPAPAAGVTATATLSFQWSGDNYQQSSHKYSANKVSNDCKAPSPTATAVLTFVPATCSSAETVSEGAVSNAAWAGAISYTNGGTTYKAVANGTGGSKFASPAAAGSTLSNNNGTLTFSGTLDGKLTGIDCQPRVCIPATSVSYHYTANDDNAGYIDVVDVPHSTGVLCKPFWVTATSWKYTNNNSIWPQVLDVVDKVGEISTAGHFPFAAKVSCGQGDIYASYDSTAPSLNPGPNLYGPGNPFAESFLSGMGFSGGASPTYTNDSASCFIPTPETGTPTDGVLSCTANSSNFLTLPAVPGGVWTVTSAHYNKTYGIGTGITGFTPTVFEKYTIVLTDGSNADGYTVTGTTSYWTPVNPTTVDCNSKTAPVRPKSTDIVKCGDEGSITIPTNTPGVIYSLDGNVVADGTVVTGLTGKHVVTAAPAANYEFDKDAKTTFKYDFGSAKTCDVSVATLECTADGNVSSVPVQVTLDNTSGDDTSEFVVKIEGTSTVYTFDVPKHTKQTESIGSSGTAGETVDVYINGSTTAVVLTVDKFDGCVPVIPTDPSFTPLTCTGTTTNLGSISTDGNPALVYTLTGPGQPVDGTVFPSLPNTPTISGLASGDYTVSVTAQAGFLLQAASPKVFPVDVPLAPVNCVGTQQTPVVTFVSPKCQPNPANIQSTGFTTALTEIQGTITIPANDNMTFTISDGTTTVPAAAGPHTEADGTYTVVATLTSTAIADGFTFGPSAGYTVSADGKTATFAAIAFTSECGLPTLASWHSGATGTPAVCTASGSSAGTITLVHGSDLTHTTDEDGKVTYTLVNNGNGHTTNLGSSALTVSVAPGSYTVKAVPTDPADGLVGNPNVTNEIDYSVTIAAATADCDGTLAFTGGTIAWAGFVLAGGMLFLGIAFLLIRRRGNRTAE